MITVEIWSDVVCPFCYIGKRRFENALREFEHGGGVEVQWRSFQLDPATRSQPGQSIYEHLARSKGIPFETSRRMHERLAAQAAELGLTYNFDKAVIANTFDAHRLTHMARQLGHQAEAEELLFASYFTEGRDLEDPETLAGLGARVGLDTREVRQMLAGDLYRDTVRAEAREAVELGADGVPFFVFNRSYAVSGAQPPELFLQVLQKVWEEQAAGHPLQEAAP